MAPSLKRFNKNAAAKWVPVQAALAVCSLQTAHGTGSGTTHNRSQSLSGKASADWQADDAETSLGSGTSSEDESPSESGSQDGPPQPVKQSRSKLSACAAMFVPGGEPAPHAEPRADGRSLLALIQGTDTDLPEVKTKPGRSKLSISAALFVPRQDTVPPPSPEQVPSLAFVPQWPNVARCFPYGPVPILSMSEPTVTDAQKEYDFSLTTPEVTPRFISATEPSPTMPTFAPAVKSLPPRMLWADLSDDEDDGLPQD